MFTIDSLNAWAAAWLTNGFQLQAYFFPCHLLSTDIERQIAVPASRLAPKIDLKRGQYWPACQKDSEWLDRSVQVYEKRRHPLSSHRQVRSNLDSFVPFFFCFLRM
ncbi:hypothetical protein AYO43_06755 [Nitrospira sp. SCGC AG-212-E16]|nr:hypothetical protein AYO43_06755 [Nitrospira sp. SCGC AG-212-E16]